jgi:transcriptional antiterminator RfaH
MLRWYLIHTKPAGETLARCNLQRQGYEVYYPRALQVVRSRGRWQDRVVALFPRYLFLGLREGYQALAPVRSTLGVANVVRFGSEYTVVPELVISQLQSRADPVSGLHRIGDDLRLTRGTAVRIAHGPFEGLEGVFEREAGSERVIVLLKLLSHSVPTCLSADVVLPYRVA